MRILFSMEGKYMIEYFIWYKKLGKIVSREEIILKEAEKFPDWVDMEMVDK